MSLTAEDYGFRSIDPNAPRGAYGSSHRTVIVSAAPDTGADSAAAWQTALDVALTSTTPIRVIAAAGTYVLRNVRIHANTWLDLAGVTLQHGGANGTLAPLESVQSTMYAEGSNGALVRGIRVTGATFRGSRSGNSFAIAVDSTAQDGLQFNYCDTAVVDGVSFTDHNQDALVYANSSGGIVQGCTFAGISDGAIELRSGSGYRVLNNRATVVRDFIPAKPDVEDVVVSGNTVTCFGYAVAYLARGWRISDNDFSAVASPDGVNGATSGLGVYGTRHPSVVAADNTISDIVVHGNRFRGWTGSRAVVFSTLNGQTLSRIEVSNNTFSACFTAIEVAGESQVIGNGITAIARAVRVTGPNCVVSGNRILVSGDAGNLAVDIAGTDTVVSGNRIHSVGATSPSLNVTVDRVTVSGNRITADTSTSQCIYVSGSDCTVTGNIASGHNHGIRIAGNRNVVTGNRCRDVAFNGLQTMTGATSNLLAANVLLNNPTALLDGGTTTVVANNVTA